MVLQEVEQPRGRSVGDAAVTAMRQAGYTVIDGSMQKINGQDAHVGLYRGSAKGAGKVMMRAAHISVGRQLYVVAGFAPESEFALVDRDIQPSVQTFRQLSMSEASNVRPNRTRLLRRPPGRFVAIDCRATEQGFHQCGDAGDHERSRSEHAAAARRSRQDRHRRMITVNS